MMKKELEEMAKCEVTAEGYTLLEKMYMSVDLSKQDFVALMLPVIRNIRNRRPRRLKSSLFRTAATTRPRTAAIIT